MPRICAPGAQDAVAEGSHCSTEQQLAAVILLPSSPCFALQPPGAFWGWSRGTVCRISRHSCPHLPRHTTTDFKCTSITQVTVQLAPMPARLDNAFSLISHISLFLSLPHSFPYDIWDRRRSTAARSSTQNPAFAGTAPNRPGAALLRAQLRSEPSASLCSLCHIGPSHGGRELRGCSLPGLSQLPPSPALISAKGTH